MRQWLGPLSTRESGANLSGLSQIKELVGTGMRKCRIKDKDHLIGSDRKIQMKIEFTFAMLIKLRNVSV